jgi:hypothetical protein
MRRGIASTLALTAALALFTPRARAGEGLPDARLGIRATPMLLLTRSDVQADLRLSPEQVADAERTIDDLRDKAKALKGRNDNEAVALRGEIDTASRLWIERKLTPAQRDRLIQLDLQWEGPAAVITRPIVAENIALTDSQRQALAKAVAEHHSRRGNGPAVEADEAKLARVVYESLTEGQSKRWLTLIGPPAPFRGASKLSLTAAPQP